MKKMILGLGMAAMSLLAFANPTGKNRSEATSYAAQEHLQGMYGKVENLQWVRTKDDLLRANFSIDDEKFSAFYDASGHYVATTSEKKLEQLPAAIRKAIKTKFDVGTLQQVIHYSAEMDEAYFVSVKTADSASPKVYRVNTSGRIETYR